MGLVKKCVPSTSHIIYDASSDLVSQLSPTRWHPYMSRCSGSRTLSRSRLLVRVCYSLSPLLVTLMRILASRYGTRATCCNTASAYSSAARRSRARSRACSRSASRSCRAPRACLAGPGSLSAFPFNVYVYELTYQQIIEGIATICVGIIAFFGNNLLV